MGAGIQKGAHNLGMGDGGRADADQIDLAQKLAPVGNGSAAMMGLCLGQHFNIGIGDGQQLNAPAGLAQGFVFGGMMVAENARTDYGSFQRSTFRHAAAQKQGVSSPVNIGAY